MSDTDDDIPHTVGRNRRTYRLIPMEEAEQSAEGDNHHNAARCPYCQPTLEADRETLRRTVLEEAARACELGAAMTRFPAWAEARVQCAAAIRALADKQPDTASEGDGK